MIAQNLVIIAKSFKSIAVEDGTCQHGTAMGKQGRFPSGQRGQTVNLLATPSKVQILLSPVEKIPVRGLSLQAGIFLYGKWSESGYEPGRMNTSAMYRPPVLKKILQPQSMKGIIEK